uniref:Uncharacterized protein n=1 Tax=Rhizophora mucronata TaxID=61149 RepID=A0A2P2R1I5_RHIMU
MRVACLESKRSEFNSCISFTVVLNIRRWTTMVAAS